MPTPISISGATIYTDPPFLISGQGSVNMTCSSILTAAKASPLNNFLEQYRINPNEISQTNSIKANLRTFNTSLATLDQQTTFSGADVNTLRQINTYLTGIKTTYIPIIGLVDNCLKESLQVDTTAIKEAQNRLSESESRLASIRNPEENVSYYEGWFPIVRPMTETALFGIFAASIFMLLLSTLIFLKFTGVSIDIIIPEFTLFTLPPNSSYYMYGGLATGLIGALIYIYIKK
jgi:hypothetical protein